MANAGIDTQAGSGAAEGQQWRVLPGTKSIVDRSAPSVASSEDLARYSLMLGDDALVLSHRLSEWGTRAPGLEEDAALGGIALDLLAQARMLLSRAGELEGAGRDEDQLAYFRHEDEFFNVRLVEIDCGPGPSGDFAATVVRLVLFTMWRLALMERLARTRDPVLANIASTSVPKLSHHRDHAAQWMIRLGDGAAESQHRVRSALARIWPLVGELFVPNSVETRLAQVGCAVDPSTLRAEFLSDLDEVLSVARIDFPDVRILDSFSGPRGRDGEHTGTMQFLLAEMQYIAHTDPEARS
jgi:ring-1,2-phenylacetyl-CoA epoxidase subunit PaaC